MIPILLSVFEIIEPQFFIKIQDKVFLTSCASNLHIIKVVEGRVTCFNSFFGKYNFLCLFG